MGRIKCKSKMENEMVKSVQIGKKYSQEYMEIKLCKRKNILFRIGAICVSDCI
jgi:hypothetical protein